MGDSSNNTPGALARLLADLKQRRVFQVAAGYVVAAWVAIQVVDIVGVDLGLPSTSTTALFYAALLAFPLVVALAWVYDIGPAREDSSGSHRRLGIVLLAALPLIGAGVLLGLRTAGGTSVEQAHSFVEQASELVVAQQYGEAYDLLAQARQIIPDDSALIEIWPEVTRSLTVTSEPPGATVRARRFTDLESGAEPVWATLGTTPIQDLVVPRDDHLLQLSLDGYRPAERLFAPSRALAFRHPVNERPDSGVAVRLVRATAGGPPEGMVRIPGGPYEVVAPDMPTGFVATLDEFYIDRFEVTNEEYLEFVRADGYADETYWTELSSTRDHAENVSRFVDRTGHAGPRGWTDQMYPDGEADYPVTGVTWYEAAAYASFRGRTLLTLHQWEKAARDGAYNPFEKFVLPWGMASSAISSHRVRSLTTEAGPVDEHPFGQSPYGAYAMAGNAAEWLANRHGEGRAVAGGSWQDPLYLFSAVGGLDALHSASTLGFRTAWLDPDRRRLSQDQGLITLDTLGITPVYEPVDRATYRTFLTHYRYDHQPANAEILATTETDDWVREEIAFDGPEGARVLAYLYLPRRSPPPHQPVLFVPGGSVYFGIEVPVATEAIAGPLVGSGRAVFVVVMKGMTGRGFPEGWQWPELMSVAFRDLLVLHATEMRMGIDYLDTRSDLAMDDLVYMGWSRGAASRLAFAAVDDRFQVVVFGGGGIDERYRPVLPEVDPVNFAPYIEAPTLLINGRQDEEHAWLTRALPLWNLLSQPKELVLLEGAGHRPPSNLMIPAIEVFLDTIRARTRPGE